MVTFIKQFVIDSAVLFVFSAPLIFIARRRGREALARRFLIAAAVVAGLSAAIAASSEVLVERCFEAGNTGCVDFGSSGFRMLLIGGYIIVVITEAYLVAHD